MKTLATTLALGTFMTFMAGCAGTADEPNAASESNMTGAPEAAVTVTTKEIRSASPECRVAIDWPVVTTPNAQATAAIAKVLAEPVIAGICDGADEELTLEQDGSYTVELNEAGLLSIAIAESHFMSGMSSIGHAWYAHTFDVATGAELKLSDVLTAEGLKAAEADCNEGLGEDFCAGRFETSETEEELGFRPRFSLREDGLVILARVPEEHVIPWSKLPASSLKPGPVAAWRAGK
ncbi:MAG: hypothetical protein KIT84_19970 [Labilithrix sp.]|nr:hypothetical protein [Labilithrix sp.]MCW5813316.1 hypothetical protein [Labilithrix sp.]